MCTQDYLWMAEWYIPESPESKERGVIRLQSGRKLCGLVRKTIDFLSVLCQTEEEIENRYPVRECKLKWSWYDNHAISWMNTVARYGSWSTMITIFLPYSRNDCVLRKQPSGALLSLDNEHRDTRLCTWYQKWPIGVVCQNSNHTWSYQVQFTKYIL